MVTASATSAKTPMRVIILTPGVNGQGGISRLMDEVHEQLLDTPNNNVVVRLISTRGDIKPLRPFIFLSAILRVFAACLLGHCNLLHVNLASNGSTYRKLLLAGIAQATNTPYVIHLHGGHYREFWSSRSGRMKQLIDKLFRRAARIVVLGTIWRDLVIEHVPEASDRITIFPNATRGPTTTPPRRQDKRNVTILFIGRLNSSKGIHELIEAFSAIKNLDNWNAVLAGDGEVAQTRTAIRDAGLDDRVELTGWLNADQVGALWQRGDIFVLPSHIENLPLSILEAYAHGVPVICTSVGSIPEIVDDGRTGLIIPAGDSAALQAALQRLIENEKLRGALAEAGRAEFTARFAIKGYVERLASLWIQAATRKP